MRNRSEQENPEIKGLHALQVSSSVLWIQMIFIQGEKHCHCYIVERRITVR